jgi:hypothetical protein
LRIKSSKTSVPILDGDGACVDLSSESEARLQSCFNESRIRGAVLFDESLDPIIAATHGLGPTRRSAATSFCFTFGKNTIDLR